MATGDIETYHEGDKWKNRAQGSARAVSVHETKAEAQAAGRKLAQERRVEHIIKNLDGRIGERNSYGNDARRSPG